MTDKNNDFDAGFEKPSSNMWKPGKEGDVLKGVITGSKPFEGDYGPTVAWELLGLAGKYHDIVDDKPSEEETEVIKGEHYIVIERSTFADDIKKAKVGQQVILRFIEWRTPKKGGKDYKYVECKLGPMDPDWEKDNGPEASSDPEFK